MDFAYSCCSYWRREEGEVGADMLSGNTGLASKRWGKDREWVV